MAMLHFQLAFVLAVTLFVARTNAVLSSYNITESEPAHTKDGYYFKAVDNPSKTCTEPGSCTYANITLPPHSLRYICGYNAHNRITYYWLSKRQVQTFLVRERTLLHDPKCNIFKFDGCPYFASSRCRRTTECTRGMAGLSFGGSQCFAIVNNRDASSWFYFKVYSEKDKTLAVGNAFALILVLIVCALLLEPLVLPFILPRVKALIGRKAS